MIAHFKVKPSKKFKKSTNQKQNSSKRNRKAVKQLARFRNTFYQVLCEHNPDLLGEEADFLEYLGEQVWEESALQRFSKMTKSIELSVNGQTSRDQKVLEVDTENLDIITEVEVTSSIFEIVKNEFLNFGVCYDENQCLEICQGIVSKWKSVINPISNSILDKEYELDNDDVEEDENVEEEEEEEREPGTCELCHRHMSLGFHHLIPRWTHKKVVKRNLFTKQEVLTRGIMICGACHSACHKMISHDDMAYTYNTLEKLREHEGVKKFVTWASKQKGYDTGYAARRLRFEE
ncbi:hypothetical protein G9A89_018744 [Geosiphon pyriformis]|nr:hypothetical protein G9A89_018744 [Geosiphon pyriformis]